MKKIFIFVLFSFLVIPITSVFATSGACSYHGGVNCSVGASASGNVTCNDGWENSSVLFSDMDECKVEDHIYEFRDTYFYNLTVDNTLKRAEGMLDAYSVIYTASIDRDLKKFSTAINECTTYICLTDVKDEMDAFYYKLRYSYKDQFHQKVLEEQKPLYKILCYNCDGRYTAGILEEVSKLTFIVKEQKFEKLLGVSIDKLNEVNGVLKEKFKTISETPAPLPTVVKKQPTSPKPAVSTMKAKEPEIKIEAPAPVVSAPVVTPPPIKKTWRQKIAHFFGIF